MQKGFGGVYLIFSLIVICSFIFFVPTPYYQQEDLICKPGQNDCPQKGWHIGQTLWAKYNYRIFSPNQIAEQTQVDETVNWKKYKNAKYNFSFEYPAVWILKEGGNFTEPGTVARFYKGGEKIDPSYMMKRGNEQMTVGVTDTQNFEDLKQQSKLKEITVGDKRALELSNGAYILIDNKNILRIFRYPDEEGYMVRTLSTFKFLGNSPKGYTCSENGWVNCMPILSSEGKKQCSKEALDWKKINCQDFKGATY